MELLEDHLFIACASWDQSCKPRFLIIEIRERRRHYLFSAVNCNAIVTRYGVKGTANVPTSISAQGYARQPIAWHVTLNVSNHSARHALANVSRMLTILRHRRNRPNCKREIKRPLRHAIITVTVARYGLDLSPQFSRPYSVSETSGYLSRYWQRYGHLGRIMSIRLESDRSMNIVIAHRISLDRAFG